MFGCVTIAGLVVVVGLVSGVGCESVYGLLAAMFADLLVGYLVSAYHVCLWVGRLVVLLWIWCVVLGLIAWLCWC